MGSRSAFGWPVVLILLCMPGLWSASLEFSVLHREVTPKSTDRSIEVSFPFTNKSAHPITIEAVTTDCGCLVAPLEKKIYQPGETGAISATYTMTGASGQQQKSIKVSTNDPDTPVKYLKLIINLPPGPTITPRILYWDLLGPKTEQVVEVQVPPDAAWRIVKVSETGQRFVPTLVATDDPKHYRITIVPLQTKHPTTGSVKIQTDMGATYTIFVQVRAKEPTVSPVP